MIFETTRCRVRELDRVRDVACFCELQSDPDVMKYCGKQIRSQSESIAELDRVVRSYVKPMNTFWVWAIESRTEAGFLGTCAAVTNKQGEQEIGYRLLRKYWGNGFASEIVTPLVEYMFESLNFPEVVAYVDSRNVPSIKVLEKSCLDFESEGFSIEFQALERVYRCRRRMDRPRA